MKMLKQDVSTGPVEVVAALHELIAALDKRIPDVTRVGESHIREQAAELRARAVRRIQELAAQDADARALVTRLSNAVIAADGVPVRVGVARS